MIAPALKQATCQRVAEAFGVTVQSIQGRARTARVALARQAAMALLYQEFSATEVGRAFFRDHGTVIHAARVIEHEREHGPASVRENLARLFESSAPISVH